MSLVAAFRVSRPALEIDVEMEVRNEVVALVGPNGAGKTTVLRALAGLLPVDHGHIQLDDAVLDDPELGVWVAPEARSTGFVFQDYLLFPNMSALDNVAFGLRARGMRRERANREAGAWLQHVGLSEYAHVRPGALSGGQAQRVALARALAPAPRLLLLDEPLAALDATTRIELRRELHRQLRAASGPRIVVTHDPIDAFTLADRVIVLEAGRVVQTGEVAELRARPRSRYVADLVGVNCYRGRADATGIVHVDDTALVTTTELRGDVLAVVHPRAVALHRRRPEGTPRNVWPGRVEHVDDEGARVRVTVDGPLNLVAEITPGAAEELALTPGVDVWASVKATEVTVSPV